jgi:hypothetical protein
LREPVLEPLGVRDEVARAGLSEHGRLALAQPPQLEGEHQGEQERDQRDPAGGERRDPLCRRELVHRGRG